MEYGKIIYIHIKIMQYEDFLQGHVYYIYDYSSYDNDCYFNVSSSYMNRNEVIKHFFELDKDIMVNDNDIFIYHESEKIIDWIESLRLMNKLVEDK